MGQDRDGQGQGKVKKGREEKREAGRAMGGGQLCRQEKEGVRRAGPQVAANCSMVSESWGGRGDSFVFRAVSVLRWSKVRNYCCP